MTTIELHAEHINDICIQFEPNFILETYTFEKASVESREWVEFEALRKVWYCTNCGMHRAETKPYKGEKR